MPKRDGWAGWLGMAGAGSLLAACVVAPPAPPAEDPAGTISVRRPGAEAPLGAGSSSAPGATGAGVGAAGSVGGASTSPLVAAAGGGTASPGAIAGPGTLVDPGTLVGPGASAGPGALASPGGLAPGGGILSNNGAGVISNNGAGVVANNGARLGPPASGLFPDVPPTGKAPVAGAVLVRVPARAADGTIAFAPVQGVAIDLYVPGGAAPLGEVPAVTDAAGRATLPELMPDQVYVARSHFTAGGRAFYLAAVFRAPAAPDGPVATLDPLSTAFEALYYAPCGAQTGLGASMGEAPAPLAALRPFALNLPPDVTRPETTPAARREAFGALLRAHPEAGALPACPPSPRPQPIATDAWLATDA